MPLFYRAGCCWHFCFIIDVLWYFDMFCFYLLWYEYWCWASVDMFVTRERFFRGFDDTPIREYVCCGDIRHLLILFLFFVGIYAHVMPRRYFIITCYYAILLHDATLVMLIFFHFWLDIFTMFYYATFSLWYALRWYWGFIYFALR